MDDGDKFPKTFDEWERTAKRRLASAAAAGVTIEPVILDPGEFLGEEFLRTWRPRAQYVRARSNARGRFPMVTHTLHSS
jgi:hypothetical protein